MEIYKLTMNSYASRSFDGRFRLGKWRVGRESCFDPRRLLLRTLWWDILLATECVNFCTRLSYQ